MALRRGVHPAALAAISAGNFNPVIMVHLDWPGQPVRAHSNIGNLTFAGHSWTGVGNFGQLAIPAESVGVAQARAILQLHGLPDDLDDYLDDDVIGRFCEIWMGVVTERMGNVLIGAPWRAFVGYIDGQDDSIEATGEDGDVTRGLSIPIANGPSQRLAVSLHHTDEDQRARHPDDTAGRLLLNAEARFARLTWPE